MAVTPIAFAGEKLIGLLHGRPDGQRPKRGVVLCNPFGQEAIRAHRMLRVLAERLSRAGCDVLRFDYRGTGDSSGDDEDADLETWAQDVQSAHAELKARTGVEEIVWIGMRLGALVALVAAQRPPDALRRVVLWDPVLSGTAYLDYIRQSHIATLEVAFSIRRKPGPRVVALDPSTFREEAMGFSLPPNLRRQLAAVDGLALIGTLPVESTVVYRPGDPEYAPFGREDFRTARSCNRIAVAHDTDWTAETAGNTALVPTGALMNLTEQASR